MIIGREGNILGGIRGGGGGGGMKRKGERKRESGS